MKSIQEYVNFCVDNGLVPCRADSLSKYYANKNK